MKPLLAAALVAALAGGCAREREASPDSRTAVRLTAEQRNAVLTEMRSMLASVNAILGATARRDSSGIRSAAAASGMQAAADPALESLLPAPWLQIAMQVHGGFDSLAAGAGRGRDTVVARLGRITTGCLSCHAMYRLTAD